MASVLVRTTVYDLIVASPALHTAGFAADAVYPNYGPVSPPQRRFIVIRWGGTAPGVGRANSTDMALWFYDRDQDWAAIQAAIRICRPVDKGGDGLLDTLPGARMSATEAILGLDWTGGSTDLFDDVYEANTRNEAYRVTASGN